MERAKRVTIKEVGPRDGLQNEKGVLQTSDKVALINELSETGLRHIEITSFTNPRWIPALADAVEVAQQIKRVPGIVYSALVPNQRGLVRALEANIDEVAVFMSASETHNQKNINKSIQDTYPIFEKVVKDALGCGKSVRGYVSMVFGCPYEGTVKIDAVVRVAEKLFEMGVQELSLGDTIGIANPHQVQVVLSTLLRYFDKDKLAMHFHDTHGTALANILTSIDMGITTFDSSIGGSGGCPYAPGASGNVATEDLHYMLSGMGIHTGLNRNKLLDAAILLQNKLGKQLPSHSLQVCNAGIQAVS